jgi:hypothetical protein
MTFPTVKIKSDRTVMIVYAVSDFSGCVQGTFLLTVGKYN